MPLSSANLANLRARSDTFILLDTCTIEVGSTTPNASGGQGTVTWTARGTAIPCNLVSVTGQGGLGDITRQGGRLVPVTEYTLYIANDGTIVAGDRVTLNSIQYNVEGVIDSKTYRAFIAAKMTLMG